MRALLSTCDDTVQGVRDRAIITVMAYHGLRLSEISAMTPDKPADWPTLQFGGYLTHQGARDTLFLRGKGQRDRVHPVQAGTLAAVKSYLHRPGRILLGDTAPLFQPVRRTGHGISGRSIRRMLCTRAKRAGLQGQVSPHTLRRSCATALYSAGATLAQIRDYLGHTNIATTELYVRLSNDLSTHAALQLSYED